MRVPDPGLSSLQEAGSKFLPFSYQEKGLGMRCGREGNGPAVREIFVF
jgi:hypothetical protein